MSIAELIKLAIDKKIDYIKALEELKKLKLPEDTEEEYEGILYKLLGDEKRLDHRPKYTLECIPNDYYFEILTFSIKMIRDGMYTPEVINELYMKYQLGPQLLNYFINESISIVRMNNMSPEEITSIGEAYHMIASQLESRGLRQKPVIKSSVEINAEPTDDIDLDVIYEDEE